MLKRLRIVVVLSVLGVGACAHAPSSLTPKGVVAFHATQVVRSLDQIRDVAVAANAQAPPLLSTDSTRKIVEWHRAAIQTVAVSPAGWRVTVSNGLNDLVKTLPADEQKVVNPYVALALVLLNELS